MTNIELLKEHVSALFALDNDKRLVAINEPWDQSKPAPLVYVGRTLDSKLTAYLRYDVDNRLYRDISRLVRKGVYDPVFMLNSQAAGMSLRRLCYAVPPVNAAHEKCTFLRPDTINDYDLYEFTWLKDEISVAQPCCAYIGRCKSGVCLQKRTYCKRA